MTWPTTPRRACGPTSTWTWPAATAQPPRTCKQVAAAIAEAAGSNFLVAGLAARARADEPVIDVNAPGWRDRQRFPVEVGQAFEDYLTRFGQNETRVRDLLRALAYAEGPGLSADALWADMASGSPRRATTKRTIWHGCLTAPPIATSSNSAANIADWLTESSIGR